MTNPLDAVRGDPVDSYDWTGDDMDGEAAVVPWDDALDGPVYPGEPFCDLGAACYEVRETDSRYCTAHRGREAA